MPAKITIQSGISAGTSHWIEQRVARIGSDPQSEVCLPMADIPAHALTVEFRDNTCRVYNRCQDNICVGTQVIGPNQVAAWPETDILQLGSEVELVLDFDDVVPSVADSFLFDDEADADGSEFEQPTEVATDEKTSDGFKTIMQLVVTVLCLVVCAAMMLYKPNKNGGVETVGSINFEKLIADARNSSTTSRVLIQRCLLYTSDAADE